MSNIRKKTIISSVLVYIGFLIGAVNIYFYTTAAPFFFKSGNIFTPEQFALTRVFFDSSAMMCTFATLGVIPVIYKFYPYYKDNLPHNKIDLVTWAMLISLFGFIILCIFGWYLSPLFIRKFSANSKLAVDYYFWLFPFTMGLLFFSVLEGFCWALEKSIISNFLKETALRIFTTVFILLYVFRFISFNTFVILFSLLYFLIFLILFIYLYRSGHLPITFRVSRVTRKFLKKMGNMQVLIFGGTVFSAIAVSIDSLIIASVKGLAMAGIFTFAQYAANLIQVPQRSITSVSAGVLSRAWKEKNYTEIDRIYSRSCINLLLMALFIFGNLWLNLLPAMQVLHIQGDYKAGIGVVFVLSMLRIIDAGTGLNQMVINTSTFWRFDFYSGIVLFAFRLPLTYILIKKLGIIGSAFAELTAFTVYNIIRCEFLRRKFNMQPFSLKTLYSLLLAAGAYALSFFLLKEAGGWLGLVLRGGIFSVVMIGGTIYWNLTPDAGQLIETVRKRIDQYRS